MKYASLPGLPSSICVDNNEIEKQDRPVIKDRHLSGSEKSTGTVHVQGYFLQMLAHGGLVSISSITLQCRDGEHFKLMA